MAPINNKSSTCRGPKMRRKKRTLILYLKQTISEAFADFLNVFRLYRNQTVGTVTGQQSIAVLGHCLVQDGYIESEQEVSQEKILKIQT